MNKTKQQLTEIEGMISKMECNHFLLPDSWSGDIEMIEHDWSYRTYVSAPRDYKSKRYINIEITLPNKSLIKLDFRGLEIQVNHTIGKKAVTAKDVLYYVSEIYKEKHSFENHDDGNCRIW